MTQAEFVELEGNIQKTFDAYSKQKPDYLKQLFNVQTSTKAIENHFGVGAFGQMTPWTGTVAYDDFAGGYTNQYRHEKYSTGVEFNRELYDDEEFQAIKSRVNGTAYAVHKTLQVHGADVFNKAFEATGYNGPDGVSLCSDSHKISGRTGEVAQSNTGVLDLTIDNIDTVMLNMRNFKDDRGDVMDVLGDTIIVGSYWAKTVKQIVGSDKEAYTANNEINVFNDLKYIINPYITGKKWFMANMDLMKGGDGLNFFMRRDPKKLERDSDFDSEVLKWKNVGRWSKGWDTFAFIYGNNPA